MAKRMLAFLCTLALMIGMIAAPASAASVGEAYENYQVGYSKKDITPWINYTVGDKTLGIAEGDYSDAAEHIATTTVHKYDGTKFTGETEQRQIVSISMGGHGDSLHRVATCLTDDNGDGFIGYGDGIFITCTSVTDDSGNTVMYFTVDTTGSDSTMTSEVREKVVAALGRSNISENQIMFTANHSHAGPAFGNHRKAAAGTAWRAYYDFVVDQMVEAAKEAFNNKAVATMSKGEINVSSSLRSLDNSNPNNADADYSYRLNNIRHYNVTSDMYKSHVYKDSNGNIVESGWGTCTLYPACESHLVAKGLTTIYSSHGGKPFREQPYNHMDADGNLLGTTTGNLKKETLFGEIKGEQIEYVDIYKNMENDVFESSVADADETLYVLQFEREDAEPVVLINWRAHSTMNGNGNWRNLSSDFANSLRYRLENNATLFGGDTNYCVAFWQGAGGNIVTAGQVESAYNWKNADFMPETEAAVKTAYASVTKDENDKITAVEYPEDSFFDTYYKSFQVSLYDNEFYYTNKYGYLLGEVTLDCLDSEMKECSVGSIATKQVSMELNRQQFSEGLLAAAAHWQTLGGSANTNLSYPFRYTWTDGNVYILNSSKHATEVAGRIGKTNTMMGMELNVITIGSDVAMVTLPNEPFDHYSDEYIASYDVYNADGKITAAEWEELTRIGQTDNDWYDLGEFSYGMPFVLGYTNSAHGYLPNAWSYDYNTYYEGDTYYGIYGPGCYESNTADMERGSGEAVIAKLKEMLETINDGKKTAYCEACDEIVVWEPLSADQLQVRMTDGHHYLTENMTKHKEDTYRFDIGASDSTMEKLLSVKVCLDLNGKTMGVNTNAFRVKLTSTLNIMDSVGGGEIVSTSGITGEVNAGMIYLRGTGTLNLYSGTLRAVRAENADPNYGVSSGAVIGGGGRFNMYGGQIIGGELIGSANGIGGAAISLTKGSGYGDINLFGGSIQSGKTADGQVAPCVYVGANTPVKLSGNATVEDIYFANNAEKLTVSNFTGSVHLTYASDVSLSSGTCVGTVDGSVNIASDTITCGDYMVVGDMGSLWLFDSDVKASLEGVPYTKVNDAVSDYTDGDIIKLVNSTDETVSVPVGKTVYVDLNGFDIESVEAEGTVYCLDTQTDDYKVDAVNHTDYGKIMSYTGNVKGAPIGEYVNAQYLKVEDTTHGTSFHRVVLQITDMTLRPKEETVRTYDPSLYYKCDFLGDEIVAENVENFGVALSIAGVPEDIGLEKCGYSKLEGFQPGLDGNAGRSTLLKGIMKESNASLINKRNAGMVVYGQAYVKLKDSDSYLYGEAQNRSFKQQIEKMDTNAVWNRLDATHKDSAAALYAIYEKVMTGWTIPNITAHADSEENETLKVLVVGNSHSADSMNLLYEVFQNEAPEQKIVLGRLYIGGCSMRKHAQQIGYSSYSYYKMNSEIDAAGKGWEKTDNVSMQYGLQDEQWDIVVMQEMNRQSGNANSATLLGDAMRSFQKADFMKVINHIQQNVDEDTKLAWNMVWTNPNETEMFNTYSDPTGWGDSHATLYPFSGTAPSGYGFDQNVMYQGIVNCVNEYIVDSTDFLGESYFDMVIPSATSVQYAQDVQGLTEKQTYSDYTHLTDYSRLMVAYVWYAKLMDLNNVDAVNVNEIPSVLWAGNTHRYPAREDNKCVVTAQMQSDIKDAVNWTLAHPYELP